ncbi:MAG: glycoside hydrolase family 32 protein [Oscillibacter sp.]|nr:glycoside hydrolase family 32 protein [Oscillibacter sp.]MBQ9617231.1 glycoside hydrolase family 32 protein [Oscillibacter sp.]
MSQALRDARRYEEAREALIPREARPAFHLSARVGWLNDPNGFSWYKGQYHLFYQYHPYDSHWGPMHWGHAVSWDLLHWNYLPAAMAPDRPFDRDGCFSGTALSLPDGRHLLMYTGNAKEFTETGEVREVQTQNLAFGDGIDYEKYEHNPVITAANLPEGGSRHAFRDPKIWQARDGSYRALIANRDATQGGQMLLYKSVDLEHWELVRALQENRNRIGNMWECPDFFELDGKYVLLGSSQDMLPKALEYHNGNGTFYFLGDYDPETETFTEEVDHAIDYGIDFYAPQTILSPDGRRIMIGWMQNWDTCNLHVKSTPWFGQMSIPRELSVKNGILYQTPVRELERLRRDEVSYENVTVEDGEVFLPGVAGRLVDLEVTVEPDADSPVYNRFALRFAINDQFRSGVSFRPHESTLKVDRKFSGSRRAIIHQRRANVPHKDGRIKLRLILDRYSAEVFVDDGAKVMTFTINTDLNAEGISFFADGKLHLNVKKYNLSEA